MILYFRRPCYDVNKNFNSHRIAAKAIHLNKLKESVRTSKEESKKCEQMLKNKRTDSKLVTEALKKQLSEIDKLPKPNNNNVLIKPS